MSTSDRIIQLIISVFLIVGVYQFYFWCQRNPVTAPRTFSSSLDERIPYWPGWVWVYSFLYYPVIVAINWVVTSPRHYLYVAISYMLLLAFQMLFFTLFPVEVPVQWRAYNTRRDQSERFLAFVQSFDARSNSFPSMHMSVAMLTALHLYPGFGSYAFAFPVLIGLSCLFTKQHYLIDLPAGALLGWWVFGLFKHFYTVAP
jgi:membrane-associated phospholipid phosphatase